MLIIYETKLWRERIITICVVILVLLIGFIIYINSDDTFAVFDVEYCNIHPNASSCNNEANSYCNLYPDKCNTESGCGNTSDGSNNSNDSQNNSNNNSLSNNPQTRGLQFGLLGL